MSIRASGYSPAAASFPAAREPSPLIHFNERPARRVTADAARFPGLYAATPAHVSRLSGQATRFAVWVFVSVPPVRMEAQPLVPRWRLLYLLEYNQQPVLLKEPTWAPPGPLFDAFVVGLFLVLAIGYMA